MKLSQDIVAGLEVPPGKTELIVFDDAVSGFGVRVRAGGSRTWVVQYQVGTKQRRVSLGKVALQSYDKARKSARTLLAQVRLGDDPQANKFKARAAASITLDSVAERFLHDRQSKLRPRTLQELSRHLREHWKPLHQLQIGKIDRAMVAGEISRISKGSGPHAADHARTSLSTLFTWAVKEGLSDSNPVAATNRPVDPQARDRVLTDDELRDIWTACRDDDYGRIVRLLMLTGQRRDEIAGLRWSEVNAEAGTISLPSSRTKNKRPHIIPLSDPALALLPSRRADDRDFLFGDGKGSFTGFSAAKRRLDARMAQSAAEPLPWRLHDLRRTVATRLSELGVQPHVVEALLNHVSGFRAGVAGTYNRAVYAAEKRAALILWGEHVMSVVGGRSNVVPLRQIG